MLLVCVCPEKNLESGFWICYNLMKNWWCASWSVSSRVCCSDLSCKYGNGSNFKSNCTKVKNNIIKGNFVIKFIFTIWEICLVFTKICSWLGTTLNLVYAHPIWEDFGYKNLFWGGWKNNFEHATFSSFN